MTATASASPGCVVEKYPGFLFSNISCLISVLRRILNFDSRHRRENRRGSAIFPYSNYLVYRIDFEVWQSYSCSNPTGRPRVL